ncbi:hypothetical protein [uncultured Cohaesibacter sp.]|uniref:hypothetical protein n=1 Tax=uncultured Cohaesibacter sp. TaxID=1002546 RepID=UPI0029C95947|nr:hypothetical protein [uncultured Cohaesibacter sp.]
MKLMKISKPIKLCLATLGVLAVEAGASQAACLVNFADQSLIVFMKSPGERIEQSVPIGTRVCQTVSKQVVVQVNIVPYIGARFGCRTEIRGQDIVNLRSFSTMNKCQFEQQ